MKEPLKMPFRDDGSIPNSRLPLLVYQKVHAGEPTALADWLENTFSSHGWTNSWRWGIYPFHHYHSNTHEVLGVYAGSALVKLGGESGQALHIQPGDVIVIPAGVGHKCLEHSADFAVVGAYPDGLEPDLNRGYDKERPAADERIAKVKFPKTDPLQGAGKGLCVIWKE